MLRYGPALLGLLVFVWWTAPAAAQQGIHWQSDLEAAKLAAKQSGRLVLVHFWTPECVPCVTLEQNVFNQPGVAGAVEARFVPVKLNANEHPSTAQGLGITRVPTDVIITPEGQIVGKLISPPTPSAYIAEVTQVANRHATKLGQGFAAMAESAPLPAQLNSAYAHLPVPATVAPIASPVQDFNGYDPLRTNSPADDQFAAARAGAPPITSTVSNSNPVVAPGQSALGNPPTFAGPAFAPTSQPTSPGDRYGLPVATGAPSPATGGAATSVGSQAAAGTPASVANPYFPAAAPFASPSFAASPSWVNPSLSNPYAPTAMAQVPHTQTHHSAPAGSPGAGHSGHPSDNRENHYGATDVGPVGSTATSAGVTPITSYVSQATPPAAATSSKAAAAGTAAATVPDPRRLPAGSPPLGFDGYCPVSMRNHWKWIAGQPEWGAIHRGRTYWFAGQQEQQQFLQNPDYYSPALSGVDAVLAIDHRQVVPGRREHSLDYDNLIYLFASEATLQQFTANPERYAAGTRQAMGIQRGRLVR